MQQVALALTALALLLALLLVVCRRDDQGLAGGATGDRADEALRVTVLNHPTGATAARPCTAGEASFSNCRRAGATQPSGDTPWCSVTGQRSQGGRYDQGTPDPAPVAIDGPGAPCL